ncbi:hypothetical protein N7488_004499 [Penicillium malachiteum]|nr:hypothetical protein N7488_004499 [Penicillium malachiteum]
MSPTGTYSDMYGGESLLEWRLARAANAMKSLQHDASHTDLEITCERKSYSLHKCVACPQSEFFKAACKDKERTVIINLEEEAEGFKKNSESFKPIYLQAMVDFMYTFDYTAVLKVSPEDRYKERHSLAWPMHPEDFHLALYGLASHLGIPDLKYLILRKFKDLLYGPEFDLGRIMVELIRDKAHELKAIDSIILTPGYLDQNLPYMKDLLKALLSAL